jgi:hypothetical protein
MKKFLYLLFILSFTTIYSQNILWIKRLDLSQNEYVSGVASDSSESIIIGGSAQNLSGTSSDVLIVKYNTYGDTLWHRQYDTVQLDETIDATTDQNNNIIIASYHNDLSTEKPGLIKFSPNGELLWARMYPAFENYMLDGVASDSRCNIIACGHHWTLPQAIIVKFDTSGYPIWTRFHNWASSTEFWDIVLDAAENIIITGLIRYGPDSNALLVAKFDSNGDSIWTQCYTTGRWITHGTRTKLDNAGNIVVAGYAEDEYYPYPSDVLIFKYSPTGTMLWNRLLDFRIVDGPSGIAIDAHNNIFVSGSCGNIDSFDYFLAKYSSSGETLWTRFYDGGFDDGSGGVVVDSQNNPIISGSSSNGANYDILTIKYQGSSGIEEHPTFETKFILDGLEIYPNPAKTVMRVRCPITVKTIKIFDVSGKLIKEIATPASQSRNDGEVLVSLKGINPGIYFLRLDKETKKFLVVK